MTFRELIDAPSDGASDPCGGRVLRALACCVTASVLVLFPAQPASSQELPFRTSYPGSAPHECPTWTPPAAPERKHRQAARELASSATEAVVLGDLERARELLARAAGLDGADPDLSYGLARVLEDLGRGAEAIHAYCRVLALDAESSLARDATVRRDALVSEVRDQVPFAARMSFERGAGSAQRGRFSDAARQFAAAESQAPGWTPALYNHGVALARAGRYQEAAERLQRYLELEPEAEDAVEVAHRIGQLEASTTRSSSFGNPRGATRSDAALTLGLVMPGLGQFYSGRSRAGLVVLSAAAGAVATGLLVREVNVRCLELPEGAASCPREQVVSRRIERPLLGKTLVLAGTISILGAVEAWFRAQDGGGDATTRLAGSAAEESRVQLPSMSVSDQGRVELRLLGFSIR